MLKPGRWLGTARTREEDLGPLRADRRYGRCHGSPMHPPAGDRHPYRSTGTDFRRPSEYPGLPPRPVQMTYLGFPGPAGLPCGDYVIADHFLAPRVRSPTTAKPHCTCHSYSRAAIGNARLRRCRIGPSAGCRKTALSSDRSTTTISSTQRCSTAGYACCSGCRKACCGCWPIPLGRRTTYAPRHRPCTPAVRVAPPDYLARYTAADLFLDTYTFNAGTTANDTLWLGLPALTCQSRTVA